MRHSLEWLYPGLGIKRWILLAFAGAALMLAAAIFTVGELWSPDLLKGLGLGWLHGRHYAAALLAIDCVVLGALMAGGGLILHGEQAFTYHAPVVTGQVLNAVGVIKDIYVKESKGSTMTFVVAETTWSDATTGEAVCTTTFNIIHRI